jgi:hypothetical protein
MNVSGVKDVAARFVTHLHKTVFRATNGRLTRYHS